MAFSCYKSAILLLFCLALALVSLKIAPNDYRMCYSTVIMQFNVLSLTLKMALNGTKCAIPLLLCTSLTLVLLKMARKCLPNALLYSYYAFHWPLQESSYSKLPLIVTKVEFHRFIYIALTKSRSKLKLPLMPNEYTIAQLLCITIIIIMHLTQKALISTECIGLTSALLKGPLSLRLRLPRVLVPTWDTRGVGAIPKVSHDSLALEAWNSCEE